uniref:(California timema) hypothetical protein n=1 Tax=Timema californicum TaxID=61474 RepID=A0A7R9IY71_TIMCA|nr:unnamed protein product [Timema californicum]
MANCEVLYRTYSVPIVTYAAEAWTVNRDATRHDARISPVGGDKKRVTLPRVNLSQSSATPKYHLMWERATLPCVELSQRGTKHCDARILPDWEGRSCVIYVELSQRVATHRDARISPHRGDICDPAPTCRMETTKEMHRLKRMR